VKVGKPISSTWPTGSGDVDCETTSPWWVQLHAHRGDSFRRRTAGRPTRWARRRCTSRPASERRAAAWVPYTVNRTLAALADSTRGAPSLPKLKALRTRPRRSRIARIENLGCQVTH
jgi:hypothetical protein